MPLPAAALLALALASTARADIAVDGPPSPPVLRHALRIEGLDAHPEVVLLAWDGPDGATIHASRTWRAGGRVEQVLHAGGEGKPTDLRAPSLRLLPATAHDAWWSVTGPFIEAEMAACAKEGPLCLLGRSFAPTYTAPTGAVDCGLTVALAPEGSEGRADAVVDVVRLVEAGPDTCRLEAVGRQRTRKGAPVDEAGGICGAPLPASLALSVLAGLAARGRRRGWGCDTVAP